MASSPELLKGSPLLTRLRVSDLQPSPKLLSARLQKSRPRSEADIFKIYIKNCPADSRNRVAQESAQRAHTPLGRHHSNYTIRARILTAMPPHAIFSAPAQWIPFDCCFSQLRRCLTPFRCIYRCCSAPQSWLQGFPCSMEVTYSNEADWSGALNNS